jgi:hypothetical protein
MKNFKTSTVKLPGGGEMLTSYGVNIALRAADGKVTLDVNNWNYSTTTGKHRNAFLGESVAATRAKIASGEYELADLK